MDFRIDESLSFDTEGTWRIPGGGLVSVWATLPEFIPTDTDVQFKFGPLYNWGMDTEERRLFVTENRILKIIEIVEVFREPFNDVDGSFRSRHRLVASFGNVSDAILFKMKVS